MSPLPPPLTDLPPERPVLIAGPTGSGKSALALALAEEEGGVVVNADALQVYAHWRILTARPGPDETARVPHALYGHVDRVAPYSVGHWLRDVSEVLKRGERPIVVGGTGLYFRALTEGLAEIPEIPSEVLQRADDLPLEALKAGIDTQTLRNLDASNPVRLRRAWAVQEATGRGLAEWQADTPAPLLDLASVTAITVDAPKERLTPRLEARFDAMLAAGALDEVRANLEGWDVKRPGDRAIGAPELVSHLRGECTLEEARAAALISTRQYAKRQRTWFRARMQDWTWVPMP